MYQINLVYGYQEGECGIYHAFEAFDPNEKIDFEKVSEHIAETLDTTTDDVNYNCDMMYINVPEETVDRIIKDYIANRGVET